MEQGQFDASDGRVTIRVRHIWYVVATVCSLTLAASSGYFTLRAEVMEAKATGEELERRVEAIECLVRQQNDFHIYGILPQQSCGPRARP